MSSAEGGGGPLSGSPSDPTMPGSDPAEPGKDGAKVRSFFPETLLAAPFIETGDDGRASMDLELADSITTWRGVAVANGLNGEHGATTFGVRVFQSFFVDLNLPVEVTRGDVLAVPAVVYNYEKHALTVTLDVEADEGLELLGEGSLSVDVEAGEVKAVRIPISADKVGDLELTVHANSGELADAVRRKLRVVPDGRRVEVVKSGTLDMENDLAIELPGDIVEGSAKLLVKLYPGQATLNSEGAADILRHPSGCFEQTTASAWPNVMALEMLEADPDANPELVQRARAMVNEGYQRILTFQHANGGFSWWGGDDTPALAVTALGLAQLVDTAGVHTVDESAIDRAAGFLAAQQRPDGSYLADNYLHCGNNAIGANDLRMTAYVAWALAHAEREPEVVAAAIGYLKSQADDLVDPYTISLTLQALGSAGAEPEFRQSLVARLEGDQGGDGSIESELPTMYYAYGNQGTIENTAVGGLALLAGGSHAKAQTAAGFIAANRQGTWGYGSTQSTVQSLRLLNNVATGPAVDGPLQVSVHYDGQLFASDTITPADAEVLRQFDLTNLLTAGSHSVELMASEETSTNYEVILVYHQPWGGHAPESHLQLDVSYDTSVMSVGEEVMVTAILSTEQDEAMPIAELGLPPGFSLVPDDLEAAKQQGTLTRYEVKGGKLALYFDQLLVDQPIVMTFALKASLVVDGAVPASVVYPYYNPKLRFTTESFPISVVE